MSQLWQDSEFREHHAAAMEGSRFKTHGLRDHPLYSTWHAMVRRCTNPSANKYEDYGGRGIKVCAEWQGPDGLVNFIRDIEAVLGPRPEGYKLDRKDNNGHYEITNVRWVTQAEQNANQRAKVRNSQYDSLVAENETLRKRIVELEELVSSSFQGR